jgi:hypothetical protein
LPLRTPATQRSNKKLARIGGVAAAGAVLGIVAFVASSGKRTTTTARPAVDAAVIDAAPPVVVEIAPRIVIAEDAKNAVSSPLRGVLRSEIQALIAKADPTLRTVLEPTPADDAAGRAHRAIALSARISHMEIKTGYSLCDVKYVLRWHADGAIVFEIANRGFALHSGDAERTSVDCARTAAEAAIPHLMLIARDRLRLPSLLPKVLQTITAVKREIGELEDRKGALVEALRRAESQPDTDAVIAEREQLARETSQVGEKIAMLRGRSMYVEGLLPTIMQDLTLLLLQRDCEAILKTTMAEIERAGPDAQPLQDLANTCEPIPLETPPKKQP